MKLNYFVGTLGVLAASFLSGCATISEESVGATAFDTSVHFAKDSISGAPVTQNEIVSAVTEAAKDRTRFPYQQRWGGAYFLFQGLYTSPTADGMTVSYARGDTNGTNGHAALQSLRYQSKVSFSVAVNGAGDNSARVSFGPRASVTHGTDAIGIPYAELGPTEALAADLRTILSNPGNIIVHRVAPVNGEINVAFNSESTYANFLRKLGKYQFRGDEPKTNDMEKVGAYNLHIANKNVPVYVDVMPYRNGSKVIYRMDVPYELLGNGVQTIGVNDINEAKRKIADVAND